MLDCDQFERHYICHELQDTGSGIGKWSAHPAGAETLPDRAYALLTILSPQAVKPEAPTKSLGEAMRKLGAVGRGEFIDLSANPRHMDDFRK